MRMTILTASVSQEAELEDGVHFWLDSFFCNDTSSPFRGDDYLVANTARGGTQRGRWTRPDITLIALQNLRMVGRIDLELFGFELKRDGSADISGVFEAVAHTRFVHYAYLVWQLITTPPAQTIRDIELSCQSYGIGLITFIDANNSSSYRVLLTPVRKNPHPYDVEQYLSGRLSLADLQSLSSKIESMRTM
jgi:hypothetical protein